MFYTSANVQKWAPFVASYNVDWLRCFLGNADSVSGHAVWRRAVEYWLYVRHQQSSVHRQILQKAVDCYDSPHSFSCADMMLIYIPDERRGPLAVKWNCGCLRVHCCAACLQGSEKNIWFRLNGCFHSCTIGKVVTLHRIVGLWHCFQWGSGLGWSF